MTRLALAQDRGLQAERTDLAWTRTSLAVLAAGGLLLAKEQGFDGPARVTLGAVAAVVTAVLFVIGARRRRTLGMWPAPVTARRDVLGAGAAVLVLAALVVAYLVTPLL